MGYGALDQLDRKLVPYLNFKRGFFIEAGAHDGLNQSNTLYFEKRRGWTGLLVEPIPELAQRCRQNRPHAIVENCALVPLSLEGSQVLMRFCGLMSVVQGSMKSLEEELTHVRTGCDLQKLEPYEITVPARALSSLLDDHGIREVDFLSLDVEGGELHALQGIDFTRHRPRFMLIEARYRQEIEDFLEPYYTRVAALTERDLLFQARRP